MATTIRQSIGNDAPSPGGRWNWGLVAPWLRGVCEASRAATGSLARGGKRKCALGRVGGDAIAIVGGLQEAEDAISGCRPMVLVRVGRWRKAAKWPAKLTGWWCAGGSRGAQPQISSRQRRPARLSQWPRPEGREKVGRDMGTMGSTTSTDADRIDIVFIHFKQITNNFK